MAGIIKVRNVDRIESADIPVEPGKLVLIAGENEQGKSSILTGCIAALMGTKNPRGRLSGDGSLLRRGTDKAAVIFEYDGDKRLVTWARKASHIEGDAPIIGAVAAGVLKWTNLNAKERTVEVQKVVKDAEPTEKDFKDAVIKAELLKTKPEKVQAVWKEISDFGWNTAFTTQKEEKNFCKRSFLEVTKISYSQDALKRFVEQSGLDYDLETLKSSLTEQNKNYEESLKNEAAAKAVAAFDKENLEETISDLDVIEKQLKEAEEIKASSDANLATATALLDIRTAKLNELIKLQTESNIITLPSKGATAEQKVVYGQPVTKAHACPGCSLMLLPGEAPVVKPTSSAKPKVVIDSPELIAARQEAGAQRGKVDSLREVYQSALVQIGVLKAQLESIEKAKIQLFKLQQEEAQLKKTEHSSEDIKKRVEEIKAQIVEAENKAKAIELESKIQESSALEDILDSDGLRKQTLLKALKAFNETNFDPLAEITGWGKVAIEPDNSIMYNTFPYETLSKSAKWRCNLLLQVAIAKLEGDGIVLVDDLDEVVKEKDKAAAFKLIAQNNMAGIVCLAYANKETVPNLSKSNKGVTLWVSNGIAEEI